MSFEKDGDKLKLVVPFGFAGNSEMDVSASKEGMLFDGEVLSWADIERMHNEVFPDSHARLGFIVEFDDDYVLKPNTHYVTEFFTAHRECRVRVAISLLGKIPPLVNYGVGYCLKGSEVVYSPSTYYAKPGDMVCMHFITPSDGSAEYSILINDSVAGKINVKVKE